MTEQGKNQSDVDLDFMDNVTGHQEQRERRPDAFVELYPKVEGQVYVNRLLVLPFYPGRMEIFKGHIDPNKKVLALPLIVHYGSVENDEGELRREMYLCNRETTKALIEALKKEGNYLGKTCEMCDIYDDLNKKYVLRGEEIGIMGKRQKGDNKPKLSKEQWKLKAQSDAIMTSIFKKRWHYKPTVRFLYVVLDMDKYTQKKKFEGELGVQFLMANPAIRSGIKTQVEVYKTANMTFWDINHPRVVQIERNTTKGKTPDGVLMSTYNVAVELNEYAMDKDPDLLAWLNEQIPLVDISPWVNFLPSELNITETEKGVIIKATEGGEQPKLDNSPNPDTADDVPVDIPVQPQGPVPTPPPGPAPAQPPVNTPQPPKQEAPPVSAPQPAPPQGPQPGHHATLRSSKGGASAPKTAAGGASGGTPQDPVKNKYSMNF